MSNDGKCAALAVRPYQLLCAICSLGEGVPGCRQVEELKAQVQANPDLPLTVVANVGDVYVYQDPGPGDDTPEGADYNRKRDLDLLQRLSWPPGVTLPARTAFLCILKAIPTVAGICAYDTVTADGWAGCAKARSGYYEKGHELGIKALVPPRSNAELAAEKERSLAALYAASEVTMRPHLLLCAVCQYARGTRPPFADDNLPEFLELVLTTKPELRVRFARQADWMMCAPCPYRVPGLNACVNILGSGGMSNEKRDLDVLQKLGLHFGDALPARELYRLIFARITTSLDVCARPGNCCPAVWWDSDCGRGEPAGRHQLYEQGRAQLMARFQ